MSSKLVMYAQCHLRRVDGDGVVWHTVGFIPVESTVEGKRLRLIIEGRATDGWEVVGVGRELFPGNLLNEQSQDYKKMRKASDI